MQFMQKIRGWPSIRLILAGVMERLSKRKITWEPASAVKHLQKLHCNFHKEYLGKLTTTSIPVDITLSIAGDTVKLEAWNDNHKFG